VIDVLAALDVRSPGAWMFVLAPFVVYGAVALALVAAGRTASRPAPRVWPVARINAGLERVTGLPGWAAAAVGVGLAGLLVAMTGFYWDVAWHIDLGRDKELFTPAHTMIVLGLGSILVAGVTAVLFASVSEAAVGFRWRGLRVPYSALPLMVIGIGALTGFPLDDVWHHFYGVDVTMWGPTHLIMIGGAAISPIGLWLVLAEAGVKPADGVWARQLHVVVGSALLIGLSALQGEFDFGVPQFQLLYQPVLIGIAAGVTLVAARIVLGRWGALWVTAGFLALRGLMVLILDGAFGLTVPHFPLYLAAAMAVELAAFVVGARRPFGFGLLAGVGVGIIGLAGEWGWMQVWGQNPWGASLLPDAFLVGTLAAVGGGVIGAALGGAIAGTPVRVRVAAVPVALVALAVALTIPFPRAVGDVRANVTLDRVGESAIVHVRLSPPDAAEQERWFEVLAWQGGGRVQEPLVQRGGGEYVTSNAVPISGRWKTIIRLHRGDELMAAAVYMPPDPAIGVRGVAPGDRTVRFERDTELLLREARGGPAWPAPVVYSILLLIVAVWIGALWWVAGRVSPTIAADRPGAGELLAPPAPAEVRLRR
jgi:hypothetical protein